MRVPSSKEEFLVWPPIGGGIGIFVGTTCIEVFTQYHSLISAQEGNSIYAGYLFPAVMALAFAWRLHGKYWLGFGWAGVVSYALAWLISLFSPATGLFSSMLMLFACLSILFAVQCGLLYCKRALWQLET